MSLNLALVISGNASGAKQAAVETASAVRTLGNETRGAATGLQAHANANNQAEAASRRATDAIRGETAAQRELQSTVLQFANYKAPANDSTIRQRQEDLNQYGRALDQIRAKHNPLFAAQRQYADNLDEIAQAARIGAISEDERTAAIMRASAAYEGQLMSIGRSAGSTRLAAHEIQNLSFQANDFAMMLLSGQSFGIIMAQQGGQIAQIFGRRGLGEIIPALGAGIASLVTPTTLVMAAITALYYTADWALSAMQDSVDETDKELEKHLDLISQVAREWGDALPGLKAYNDEIERQKRLRDAIAAQSFVIQEKYQPARDALPDLGAEFSAARTDLTQIGAEAAAIDVLQQAFDDLTSKIQDGSATAKDAESVQRLLSSTVSDITTPTVDAAVTRFGDLAKQLAEVNREAEKFRIIQEKGLLTAGGKTSILSPLNPLDGFNRNPFQTEDEIMFERARRQRAEEEAKRQGAELGFIPTPRPNLEDALPHAQDLLRSQEERLELLRLEAQLIGASDSARGKLISQLEAEQEIRRRGIDVQGEEANSIRANAAAIAESEEAIDRAASAWDKYRSAGENAIDGLVDKLSKGDLSGALEGLAQDFAKFMLEMNVANPAKNAAFGSGLPTMDDLGGLKGILARMFGGADKTAAGALSAIGGQAVGSMNVTAASVIINGAGIGGSLVSALTGANNNTPIAANGNVAPELAGAGIMNFMPGLAAQSAGGGVQDQVWNFFAQKGLKPHQIAGIMGNVKAESNFNPLAVGDGGDAFGLFQHNDRRNNLFASIGGKGNLGDVGGQLDFAWKELQTTEGAALKKLLASGNVREATAAFAGFERPRGFSWDNPEGAHNFTGRLAGAEEALLKFQGAGDALQKFGQVAGSSTQNLDLFGNGLGTLGSALTSAPAGGGGGGGIFGWLAGLFGGFKPNMTAGDFFMKGFADGTENAPPGWAWVGEEGPELRKMRQGDVIRSNPRSMQMAAAAAPRPQVNFNSTIINNSDVEVSRRQEDDGAGGIREEIIIEKRVAGAMSRPGSAANRMLQERGVEPRRARR